MEAKSNNINFIFNRGSPDAKSEKIFLSSKISLDRESSQSSCCNKACLLEIKLRTASKEHLPELYGYLIKVFREDSRSLILPKFFYHGHRDDHFSLKISMGPDFVSVVIEPGTKFQALLNELTNSLQLVGLLNSIESSKQTINIKMSTESSLSRSLQLYCQNKMSTIMKAFFDKALIQVSFSHNKTINEKIDFILNKAQKDYNFNYFSFAEGFDLEIPIKSTDQQNSKGFIESLEHLFQRSIEQVMEYFANLNHREFKNYSKFIRKIKEFQINEKLEITFIYKGIFSADVILNCGDLGVLSDFILKYPYKGDVDLIELFLSKFSQSLLINN